MVVQLLIWELITSRMQLVALMPPPVELTISTSWMRVVLVSSRVMAKWRLSTWR